MMHPKKKRACGRSLEMSIKARKRCVKRSISCWLDQSIYDRTYIAGRSKLVGRCLAFKFTWREKRATVIFLEQFENKKTLSGQPMEWVKSISSFKSNHSSPTSTDDRVLNVDEMFVQWIIDLARAGFRTAWRLFTLEPSAERAILR